jgi:hypothetical protein
VKRIFLLFFLMMDVVCAHEPWLLTDSQLQKAIASNPHIYAIHVEFFTGAVIVASIALLSWVLFFTFFGEARTKLDAVAIKPAERYLRLCFGLMLVFSSFGYLSKVGYSDYKTLLAPDLFIHSRSLQIFEAIIGIGLIFRIFLKFNLKFFVLLLIIASCKFGKAFFPYLGFYLGGYLFLREVARTHDPSKIMRGIFYLQLFTGLGFIYSAINIKYFNPGLDIAVLKQAQAYTFGLSYEVFTILMCVVEISLGCALVLGYRLRLITIAIFCVFVFMSFNLQENFLLHLFIYAPLCALFFTNGVPILKGRKS